MFFFLKNGPFPASFSLFLSFQYTVDSKQMFDTNKFLLMTGFKPRTSGIGSDHSTNWATTTSHTQLYVTPAHGQVILGRIDLFAGYLHLNAKFYKGRHCKRQGIRYYVDIDQSTHFKKTCQWRLTWSFLFLPLTLLLDSVWPVKSRQMSIKVA